MNTIERALEQKEKLRALRRLIGNTPMVEILYRYKGRKRSVFAKCEYYNLTGSIKDRMALYMLQHAYAENLISPGDTIVEASSGNTGIALAAIGRHLGHPVTVVMPDWLSHERTALIRSLGATVIKVSREQNGFCGSLALAGSIAKAQNSFYLPGQFSSSANVKAHFHTTGPEIWLQMRSVGIDPKAFVAGVGTGGTVMGVGRYLRSQIPTIRIHPVEPAEAPILTTGCKSGTHRIQGISDEFIPAIVTMKELDQPVQVHDGDAIILAKRIAAEIGLGVGISAGANFAGAVALQNELGDDSTVVTVFSDSNKKYLSTDLAGTEPVRKDYLSPFIEFVSYRPIDRLFPIVL